ncbi:MAG TPA: CDGSH iron-sulfur domain-containing protein [Gammaproteobacteria bacterium]
MSAPVIAQKKPYIVELEAGDYWFCSCGKSSKQPFCDGSHKGTGLSPRKFTIEEKRKVGLCGCKQSKNGPFCDGAHKEV